MIEIVPPTIVRCFCGEDDKSGNPAAVYIDLIANDDLKQKMANRLNLPVTVYVINSKSNIPSIEFFYPNRMMPLCLHGTLAAAYVLYGDSDCKDMMFRSRNGRILKINKHKDQCFSVEVSPEKIEQPLLSPSLVSQLLNIDTSNISDSLPFIVASVGSPKLLAPVSVNILDTLNPNYLEIEKWSIKNKVNGMYVYSNDQDNSDSFYARGFNPMAGHHEDAATGVAAAALSSQLKRSIVVRQGHALGDPCKITVDYKNQDSIWVGGRVSC